MQRTRMIRFIHTADWHLGQTFFGYERSAEHKIFFDWLANVIMENKADVLLAAGDVFDSPNPSAESQRMFYDFLCRITTENKHLQTIIIAGNHDSAARLEAPNPLLESMNVTIRGIIKHTDDGNIDYSRLIIPIDKECCCLAVPYLRQGDYPTAENHDDGVRKLYTALCNKASKEFKNIIALGHLQATGSEISDDDRAERTTIGGLDCINPATFDNGITYTALGHLHKAQRVSERENVRYSGAPLPMSFAERHNKQSVTMITLNENDTAIEQIKFNAPVKLLSIPQKPMPLDDVLTEIGKLPTGTADQFAPLLEIRVAIKEPEPTLRNRIEEALNGKAVRLARIEAVSEQRDSSMNTPLTYEELKKLNPMELATDIFRQRYGGDSMPQSIKGLLEQVIDEVENM